MKIRDKLFLSFSLYILLAAILGFFAYKELGTIGKRLVLVEVADDITNDFLEVRRYEKNFLIFRDDASVKEFKAHMSELKKDIDNIEKEIVREIGHDRYGRMKNHIGDYERTIDGIVMNSKLQKELISDISNMGRRIEKRLGGKELQIFLTLRRYEKNFMLYRDEESYGLFLKTYGSMNSNGEIERYKTLSDRLFNLYKKEKDSVDKIRMTAREIQSFTENLSKKERADINSILKISARLLLFALIATIVLGTIINIRLSRSIANPIRKLEHMTKRVALGDFSEEIEVRGNDEITSLTISFNQMEERLKDAMSSLEYAVERLQEKQKQLVEAEKLASIGKFAAGIAHEINNPLTSVLTFSHLLLEQCAEGDPRREKLMMMVRDTERARSIVRQLLSFAREAPLKTVAMNVNRPVMEVIDSLKAQEVFKDIELVADLSEDLPDLSIDHVQISQVVLNILMNAIHAITPPGRICVSTRRAGESIEMIFFDTGRGIPEEHIGRVFDPFFTTKDVNKGTGLGLAVSYGIIKKHGGDIEVKSEAGKGTTFIVRLPIKQHG